MTRGRQSTCTAKWGVRVLLLLLMGAGLASCQFDSRLGDVTCDEEGLEADGRVCQDGYWVSVDDLDATDTPEDIELDVPEDSGDTEDSADDGDTAILCDTGLDVCDGRCVDTATSSEHCGSCDSPCIAEGSNSVATCEDGTCQRYCEGGYLDENRDWAKPTPAEDTDGCEAICTPTDDPTELCDGKDNDCDGRVDELLRTYYRDGDGDGFGSDSQTREECGDPPDPYVAEGGDCNDTEPAINPGVDEASLNDGCNRGGSCAKCDGVDDDCDGTVDEGCQCQFGSDTGVCRFGIIDEDGNCAAPGDYADDETTCDNKDNDCDGTTDEGCPCDYSGSSQGVCGNSVTQGDGSCPQPGGYEANESSCDGFDNDCDGAVDEGCPCLYNGSDRGVCQNATRNANGDCAAPNHYESNESSCDSRDNDCDGQTDEGVKTTYFRDADDDTYGVTGDTRNRCAPSGEYTATRGGDCNDSRSGVNPGASERCGTNRDDNCDGVINEGCACNYNGSSTGVCSDGTINSNTGNCDAPSTYENDERRCNDSLDNDCDGTADTDQGCTCVFMNQTGVCGYSSYDATGTCQETQGYEPTETSCGDGDDNDCDGQTDCQDSDCSGGCIGDSCSNDNQCASGYCNPAGECGLSQCGNGVKDSNEVLTDCGAPPCLLCPGGTCSTNADCKSQDCDTSAGVCN